jgi:hypothetical protein
VIYSSVPRNLKNPRNICYFSVVVGMRNITVIYFSVWRTTGEEYNCDIFLDTEEHMLFFCSGRGDNGSGSGRVEQKPDP